jgi:hypothetical protein
MANVMLGAINEMLDNSPSVGHDLEMFSLAS